MSEEFKLEDSKIKLILFLATPYGFLCAILYLYSFWSRFDINYLEFITLADLLLVSIYPIFGTLISVVAGALMVRVIPDKKNISKKQADRRLVIGSLCIIGIAIEFGILWGWHSLYFFLPALIALWSSVPLEKYLLSKHVNVPGRILMFIILIPLLSYGIGAQKSQGILQNQSVRYAKISQFKNIELFGKQSQIKFIGFGGKHYFFISEDNSNLYIVDSENIPLLELSKPSSEKFKSQWNKWFPKEPESELNNEK